MKVKANLIVSAVAILKTIDLTVMKLSTAYKVRKVLNECQVAIEDFESRRLKLAEKYGTLNEEGTKYDFGSDEDTEKFQAEMKALMDDEINIKIKPIPVALLDDYISIEPVNIPFIEWFISGLAE